MDFTHISEQIMQSKLKTPDVIYVDMVLIKDFFLGALLKMINSKEQYLTIRDNIHKYENRFVDNVEYVFPELGITQQEYLANRIGLSDFDIFQGSPVTNFLNMLNQIVMSINNKTAASQKKTMIKLYINTFPLQLPFAVATAIANDFQSTYAMDVRIMQRPLHKCELSFVSELDLIFTDDIKSLIEEPVYRDAFKDQKFLEKQIFATKKLGSLKPLETHKTEQELMQDFLMTESFIQLMCHFGYMPPLQILLS